MAAVDTMMVPRRKRGLPGLKKLAMFKKKADKCKYAIFDISESERTVMIGPTEMKPDLLRKVFS
jgi:hypothetical protein